MYPARVPGYIPGKEQYRIEYVKLYPAAKLDRFGHTVNGYDICGITHVKVLFHGQAVNTVECGCHLLVKLFENLFLGPEIIHIALNLFEVTAGDPSSVAEEIGYQVYSSFLNQLVTVGSGGAVGAFAYNLDLTADRSWYF